MKFKFTLLSLICSCFSVFGQVENSIISKMDQLVITELREKLNQAQILAIRNVILDKSLRVMSFNMLFNRFDEHLDLVDRWENRKERVAEYVLYTFPDIIGSQELQSDQLDDLLGKIGHEYDFYGVGDEDGSRLGDIPGIFYKNERLELVDGKTYYFSETPERISAGPFGSKNTFSFCHFKDKATEDEFIVLNTHLAFGNIERRFYEACKLKEFLKANHKLPIILTGDFNTFPFRQELALPFYDGETIVKIIEEGCVKDSSKESLFGHFGPISSTNFCSITKKPFGSEGDPGVILDHIFISEEFATIAHGIDAAKVDGHYPSDHFPVIADVVIKE